MALPTPPAPLAGHAHACACPACRYRFDLFNAPSVATQRATMAWLLRRARTYCRRHGMPPTLANVAHYLGRALGYAPTRTNVWLYLYNAYGVLYVYDY